MTADERAAIEAALRKPAQRLRVIECATRSLWLKRGERLPWHWRLRKGNMQGALASDLLALRTLGALGLPVPPVLATGTDHFVTPDMGRPLHHMLLGRQDSDSERRAAFAAAGRSLAALHKASIRHGRPSIRDMLWDGVQVTLIDFERYREDRNTPQGCAEDIMIAVHSALSYGRGPGAELDAMIANYRATAPANIWPLAVARARRYGPIAALARALSRLRPGSNELQAFPAAIDHILRT